MAEATTKPTVYIETTVVSYLTAWPSRDVIRAGEQRTTKDWWDTQRARFELFTSQVVVVECAAGDATAAADRLKALAELPLVPVTDTAARLADALLREGAIPVVASRDVLHVGVCAANGIDFLLTWNFRHLANAKLADRIEEVCDSQGFKPPPRICPPSALFEDAP